MLPTICFLLPLSTGRRGENGDVFVCLFSSSCCGFWFFFTGLALAGWCLNAFWDFLFFYLVCQVSHFIKNVLHWIWLQIHVSIECQDFVTVNVTLAFNKGNVMPVWFSIKTDIDLETWISFDISVLLFLHSQQYLRKVCDLPESISCILILKK